MAEMTEEEADALDELLTKTTPKVNPSVRGITAVIAKPETEVSTECIHGKDCPLYDGNPPFNAVTLAAMQEARDIASGKIPGKWHHTIEEMREELGI